MLSEHQSKTFFALININQNTIQHLWNSLIRNCKPFYNTNQRLCWLYGCKSVLLPSIKSGILCGRKWKIHLFQIIRPTKVQSVQSILRIIQTMYFICLQDSRIKNRRAKTVTFQVKEKVFLRGRNHINALSWTDFFIFHLRIFQIFGAMFFEFLSSVFLAQLF